MEAKKPSAVVKKLISAGYEAWYVGGCVRDTLLGRPIHDWDVTTSALPEQTMACFGHCVPTGIRHGTVTVLEDGARAEVTTYRADGRYSDSRHPEQVTFVRTLAEDLARRDFTINAMAMDEAGRVTDLYDGLRDLEKKCIRCVGEPEARFREDALRMLRAIRFSAQLDFSIEKKTWEAMTRTAHLCARLSAERVRDEMEKVLMSPHPERIGEMAQMGLLEAFVAVVPADYGWLASLAPERLVRWAGLCRLWPELDLTALRLDRHTAQLCMQAGRTAFPGDLLGWKRLVADQGKELAKITAALACETALLRAILESGQCLTLRELAVSGADFPGLKGPEIGSMLHTILYHVLEHPNDNDREKILKIFQN